MLLKTIVTWCCRHRTLLADYFVMVSMQKHCKKERPKTSPSSQTLQAFKLKIYCWILSVQKRVTLIETIPGIFLFTLVWDSIRVLLAHSALSLISGLAHTRWHRVIYLSLRKDPLGSYQSTEHTSSKKDPARRKSLPRCQPLSYDHGLVIIILNNL